MLPNDGKFTASSVPSAAIAPPAEPGGRWILLGRLVDFGRFAVIKTLADTPDEEHTDAVHGIGVLRLRNDDLEAFQLHSGDSPWARTPTAPCRTVILAGGRAYAGCGDKLVSYALANGDAKLVDPGPGVRDPVLAGTVVVSPHEDGRINLYDVASGKRRVSKVPAELVRVLRLHVLPDPAGSGVCMIGLQAETETRWIYRTGCYDDRLRRRWTRALVVRMPSDVLLDLRQLGPRYLVLDDQTSPWDSRAPPGRGRGLLLRWRDGAVVPFSDGTFATLEDATGEQLVPTPEVFTRIRGVAADPETLPKREAQIASDEARTYALVASGGTGLGGVDRATGRALFLVPLPLGMSSNLELAHGFPVVRTKFADRWVVTVHDPGNGAVVYRDVRPWAPPP